MDSMRRLVQQSTGNPRWKPGAVGNGLVSNAPSRSPALFTAELLEADG